MKKIIGAAAALAAVGVVAVAPAQAAVSTDTSATELVSSNIQANPAFYNTVVVQEITNYENTILTNLQQGVTVTTNDGFRHQLTISSNDEFVTTYNQIITYLLANAYSDAQVNQINDIINQGRALIINNVDLKVLEQTGSWSQALSIGTKSTLLDLAAQAQTIFAGGSDVLQKGTTLTEAEAQKYCDAKDGKTAAKTTAAKTGTAAAGSVVKTTGADYTANLAVFAGLVVASVGVAFVGKKYSTKIGLF